MDWNYGSKTEWDKMAAYLKALPDDLPERPKALLVISGHWEESVPTVLTSTAPPLLYDYSGFPEHTYRLKWPAPGSPELGKRVADLLGAVGIASGTNGTRGFDHGVFIPLLLSFPNAEIPTVQLSLRSGLDAAEHLKIGRALAPLRDEGVLIIGSGMSFHNMRAFGNPATAAASGRFDTWLADTVEIADSEARTRALIDWQHAPDAVFSHPRSEHLTPLFVVAGAAGTDLGKRHYQDKVMGAVVSGVKFG